MKVVGQGLALKVDIGAGYRDYAQVLFVRSDELMNVLPNLIEKRNTFGRPSLTENPFHGH